MVCTATRPLLRMRHLLARSRLPESVLRRSFSVLAIYSSFPATLYRYSPHQRSSLFDVKDLEQRVDEPFADAITVSPDNLVYPVTVANSSCKSHPS